MEVDDENIIDVFDNKLLIKKVIKRGDKITTKR